MCERDHDAGSFAGRALLEGPWNDVKPANYREKALVLFSCSGTYLEKSRTGPRPSLNPSVMTKKMHAAATRWIAESLTPRAVGSSSQRERGKMPNFRELMKRFKHHAPTEDQIPRYEKLRAAGLNVANEIRIMTPESREQSLALTHLEQAIMWANAAISRREDSAE